MTTTDQAPHANGAETVAEFTINGVDYQIDHLGILHPNQWGEYAIYRGTEQIGDFVVPGSVLKPEFRGALPSTEEVIAMAKAVLADREGAGQDDEKPAAGAVAWPLGLDQLNHGMTRENPYTPDPAPVIGGVEQSATGWSVLRVGESRWQGKDAGTWSQTAHVVLTPVEREALIAELIGHREAAPVGPLVIALPVIPATALALRDEGGRLWRPIFSGRGVTSRGWKFMTVKFLSDHGLLTSIYGARLTVADPSEDDYVPKGKTL